MLARGGCVPALGAQARGLVGHTTAGVDTQIKGGFPFSLVSLMPE